MTTTLSIVIAETPIAELKAIRTLLHRAGDRARLGWPTFRPSWTDWPAKRVAGYPATLEAICLEISAEIYRRHPGDPFSGCPSCEAGLAADKQAQLPSVPAGLEGET